MQHNYYAENEYCKIVPLEEHYLENVRKWRNDSSLSKFLRPIQYISEEDEKEWFENYLSDKQTIFWSIIDKSTTKMVGTIAIYSLNICDRVCEIGKIVVGDPYAHGKGIGYNAFLLAMCVGIKKLGIREFRLDVNNENIAALSIYIKVGFEIYGSYDFVKGGKQLQMKINRNRFEACNPQYCQVVFNNR